MLVAGTLMKTSFDRNFVIQDMTATLPMSGRWSGSSRTCAAPSAAYLPGIALGSLEPLLHTLTVNPHSERLIHSIDTRVNGESLHGTCITRRATTADDAHTMSVSTTTSSPVFSPGYTCKGAWIPPLRGYMACWC